MRAYQVKITSVLCLCCWFQTGDQVITSHMVRTILIMGTKNCKGGEYHFAWEWLKVNLRVEGPWLVWVLKNV